MMWLLSRKIAQHEQNPAVLRTVNCRGVGEEGRRTAKPLRYDAALGDPERGEFLRDRKRALIGK